jgi:hypothetical protein
MPVATRESKMNTRLTDQLNVAKQETIGPSFRSFLSAYTQKPIREWSQVVFHRNQAVEEIPPADTSSSRNTQNKIPVKVREGDVIVYVYSGSRTYHLTGVVSTKDKYERLYEIDLILEVKQALPVAKAYHEEEDPVGNAINQVKFWFEQDANSYNHDQIPKWEPQFDIWNTHLLDRFGIAIQPKDKALLRKDPHYSELARMKLEIEKKEKERDFTRREEIKDQVHRICAELLQAAADETKETLQERVREGFEKGQPTSEIWAELYAIIYAIGDADRQINLEQRILKLRQTREQGRTDPTKDAKRNTATSHQDTKPVPTIVNKDSWQDSRFAMPNLPSKDGVRHTQ